MLIAGGNGPKIAEPTEVPTTMVETLINEATVEQPTPLTETAPVNSSLNWIVVLLLILVLAGIAAYQIFKSNKNG